MNKESAFFSAVVYLYNNAAEIPAYFRRLYRQMDQHFEHFEIIAVDDFSTDGSAQVLRELCAEFEKPVTIVHLSIHQGREAAMNAGLDAAIGDYIYQFESMDDVYDEGLIFQAFQRLEGKYDIISVRPEKQPMYSRLFYRFYNCGTVGSAAVSTELFSIVTRRAVNRVHSVSAYLPHRKSAFAASGLQYEKLVCSGKCLRKERERLSLGVESILLYTQLGYKASSAVSMLMFVLAFAELLYTIVVFCLGIPIEGWTTITLFITFGFAGLFLIMTIVIKYLALILRLLFKKQQYLVGSVEKLQK